MKRYWAYRWAKFLERKDLRQYKHSLASGPRMRDPKCCLGHLEKLVGTEFVQVRADICSANGEVLCLSSKTMKKVGIKTCNGGIPGGFTYKGNCLATLAKANDEGMSLPEIAKLIRTHWRVL